MEKVIETNLMLYKGCEIKDHQSRVVEIDSWDDYLQEVKNGECITKKSYIGRLDGCTIPKACKVLDFVSDEIHASCTVILRDGFVTKKLMYRVIE